jgi:hypothetical protein
MGSEGVTVATQPTKGALVTLVINLKDNISKYFKNSKHTHVRMVLAPSDPNLVKVKNINPHICRTATRLMFLGYKTRNHTTSFWKNTRSRSRCQW